jgi:hypothetical protein
MLVGVLHSGYSCRIRHTKAHVMIQSDFLCLPAPHFCPPTRPPINTPPPPTHTHPTPQPPPPTPQVQAVARRVWLLRGWAGASSRESSLAPS